MIDMWMTGVLCTIGLARPVGANHCRGLVLSHGPIHPADICAVGAAGCVDELSAGRRPVVARLLTDAHRRPAPVAQPDRASDF